MAKHLEPSRRMREWSEKLEHTSIGTSIRARSGVGDSYQSSRSGRATISSRNAVVGGFIEDYPTGTGATVKELGDGSSDLIVSTTGWDINPRALGILPKEARITVMKGHHWVSHANYMVIPKGLPADHLAVVQDIMAHVLQPKMQAYAYDEGNSYPGPAVKNVPLDHAPAQSQAVTCEYARLEYAALIADYPIELPLRPDQLVLAFRCWDETIGNKVGRH